MAKAARAVSAGQSFLGATVSFYAPSEKVDAMLERLGALGIRAKFNKGTGGWEAQASMLNFADKETNALIKEHGAFSDNFRAAKAERSFRSVDLRAGIQSAGKLPKEAVETTVVDAGKERPVQKEDTAVPRRSAPMTEPDMTSYAARAAWAKEQGKQFLAAYVLYGFSLAGERVPERRREQLDAMKAAGTDDIREVANRNSQRYGELAAKEDRVRFDFVVQNDDFWKGQLAQATSELGPEEGQAKVFGDFARLDHHEKRELASRGRDTPVGLSEADRGLMVSLASGWRAMEQEHFERTNVRFSQGIVAAASRKNSVIDATAGSLRSVAAETQSVEGARAAQRVREAAEVEI